MDLKDIKDLIQTLNTTNISEFELEQEGFKLKICKRTAQAVGPYVLEKTETPLPQDEVPILRNAAHEQGSVAEVDKGLVEITAPMVGTFYRAPSPESPPFVKEGDLIEPGTSLCIIEAMKLMNEIESEKSGRIVKILVENGQPVEYGQPLFLLEPRK